MSPIAHELKTLIRDIPDFPKPGIVFKDIGPLLKSPSALKRVVRHLAEHVHLTEATHIVGVESRGFLFGVPLALECALPFVPVRKKGKLPGQVVSETYSLEYGTDTLEIQADAFPAGSRVLIIDDVLATGGTATATLKLVEKAGGKAVGASFLIDLTFLDGRRKLEAAVPGAAIHALWEIR